MAKRVDDPYRDELLMALGSDPADGGLGGSGADPTFPASTIYDDPAPGSEVPPGGTGTTTAPDDPSVLPPSDEVGGQVGDTETVPPAASTPTLGPVLAGWDTGKWNDPTHTTIKYVAGRIFSRYAPSDWLDPTKQAQILADLRAAGLNPTVVGKDQIDFGDGAGPIDVVQGANAGGQAWQWGQVSAATPTSSTGTGTTTTSDLLSLLASTTPTGTGSTYVNGVVPIDAAAYMSGGTSALSPAQSAYAYPATSSTTPAGTVPMISDVSYTPTYASGYKSSASADALRAQLQALLAESPVSTDITLPSNDLSDPLHSTLLSLMTMDPTAVSIDDPALASSAEAYRRGQERSMQQRIRDAAERSASMGLGDSGAAVSEADRYSMDYGNAIAAYNADLVTNEIAARRNQVMQALQTGAGVLSSEQSLALQEQLAELNAQLAQSDSRRTALLNALGLAQSNEQAQNQYGLNAAALANSANYNQAQIALANAARNQNAAQFAQTMGYNYAQLSQADRQWLANLQAQLAMHNQTMQYNYDTLGAQIGYNQALLNQNALLAALGS